MNWYLSGEMILGVDRRPKVEYAEVRVGRHSRDDIWIRGAIGCAVGTIANRERPERLFPGRGPL